MSHTLDLVLYLITGAVLVTPIIWAGIREYRR